MSGPGVPVHRAELELRDDGWWCKRCGQFVRHAGPPPAEERVYSPSSIAANAAYQAAVTRALADPD